MDIRDGEHFKFLIKSRIREIKNETLDALANTAQTQIIQAGIQPVITKSEDEVIIGHQSNADKLATGKLTFEVAYNAAKNQAAQLVNPEKKT